LQDEVAGTAGDADDELFIIRGCTAAWEYVSVPNRIADNSENVIAKANEIIFELIGYKYIYLLGSEQEYKPRKISCQYLKNSLSYLYDVLYCTYFSKFAPHGHRVRFTKFHLFSEFIPLILISKVMGR